MPFQVVLEDAFAVIATLLIRHILKTSAYPCLSIAFNNEGAGRFAVGIAVGDERSAVIAAEDQRKRVE